MLKAKRAWRENARALQDEEVERLRTVVRRQLIGKSKADWKLLKEQSDFAARNIALLEMALTTAVPMRLCRLILFKEVADEKGALRSPFTVQGITFGMNDRLRVALTEYIEKQPFHFQPDDALFFSYRSKGKNGVHQPSLQPCSARTLENMFRGFHFVAGIAEGSGALSSSCFRRTAALNMWRKTNDIKQVAKLLNVTEASARAYIPVECESKRQKQEQEGEKKKSTVPVVKAERKIKKRKAHDLDIDFDDPCKKAKKADIGKSSNF
jgi:hypothetical protein